MIWDTIGKMEIIDYNHLKQALCNMGKVKLAFTKFLFQKEDWTLDSNSIKS